LTTNLSLLALPGVRTEFLKRVLSHSQVRLHVTGPFSDVVVFIELLYYCRKPIVVASNPMQHKKYIDCFKI